MVLVQQACSQARVGYYHFVHGMYDPVFHGVVFQFVDDGGTPVDDAERHAVGINCVTIRYDNYG